MGPFWAVLALTLPFTVAAYSSVRGDIWWNLSTGRWVIEHRALPTEYPFSFAPQVGQFYDTQWLAHVITYGVHELLGLEGVILLNVLVVTATFAFVLALAWEYSQNRFVAAGSTAVCGLLAISNLQPRAQTFGFLLFAVTYWLVTRPQPGLLTVAGAGAVQVLWSNLHGSMFLGPVLTCLMLAGEVLAAVLTRDWRDPGAQRRVAWLVGFLAVQVAATLATPYGLSGLGYAYGAMTDPTARRYGEEWLPPTLSTYTGAAFFVSVGVVAAAVGFARRIRPTDGLVLLCFGWFGLQAVRNVIWWGISMTPILAWQLVSGPMGSKLNALETSARTQPRGRRVIDTVMAGFLVLLMIGTLPWFKDRNPVVTAADRPLVSPEEPEGAAAFLASRSLPSRVFAPQVWGAYLGWRLWPSYSMMVGPIIEIHPPAVWTDYLNIAGGRDGWEELLDRYGVDLIALDVREQTRLLGLARASDRWTEVYSDGQAAVFQRAQTIPAPRF